MKMAGNFRGASRRAIRVARQVPAQAHAHARGASHADRKAHTGAADG